MAATLRGGKSLNEGRVQRHTTQSQKAPLLAPYRWNSRNSAQKSALSVSASAMYRLSIGICSIGKKGASVQHYATL